MREYLDLEFSSVAHTLPFEYDLERIIDDFILMSIFVGNDFLPNLPGLHINEGALELIWKIYKENLAEMGMFTCESNTKADVRRLPQRARHHFAAASPDYAQQACRL